MDLVEVVSRTALFCVGVAVGVGIAQVLNPVVPPVGRLLKRLSGRVRND